MANLCILALFFIDSILAVDTKDIQRPDNPEQERLLRFQFHRRMRHLLNPESFESQFTRDLIGDNSGHIKMEHLLYLRQEYWNSDLVHKRDVDRPFISKNLLDTPIRIRHLSY